MTASFGSVQTTFAHLEVLAIWPFCTCCEILPSLSQTEWQRWVGSSYLQLPKHWQILWLGLRFLWRWFLCHTCSHVAAAVVILGLPTTLLLCSSASRHVAKLLVFRAVSSNLCFWCCCIKHSHLFHSSGLTSKLTWVFCGRTLWLLVWWLVKQRDASWSICHT